jgi:hypothetical protein
VPSPEICNNIDDDCDGQVDEGLGSTTCGLGVCAHSVDNCVGGQVQTCVPGTPSTEVCNGLDDDCDGQTDENLGNLTCGLGNCTRVVPACVGGQPQTCVPAAPLAEVCNGLDDDCDGQVDENYIYYGPLAPVSPDGSGIFQQKSTIPLKFRLTNCRGMNVTSAVATFEILPFADRIVGTVLNALNKVSPDVGNTYYYDVKGSQYMFNLGTKALLPGASYIIRTHLDDGSVHDVVISLSNAGAGRYRRVRARGRRDSVPRSAHRRRHNAPCDVPPAVARTFRARPDGGCARPLAGAPRRRRPPAHSVRSSPSRPSGLARGRTPDRRRAGRHRRHRDPRLGAGDGPGGPAPWQKITPAAALGTHISSSRYWARAAWGWSTAPVTWSSIAPSPLKVIRPELASRPRSSIASSARSSSPAASRTERRPQFHDLGEVGDLRFISMSFIEEACGALLDRKGRSPRAGAACRWCASRRRPAGGARRRHRAHRDLKPHNV